MRTGWHRLAAGAVIFSRCGLALGALSLAGAALAQPSGGGRGPGGGRGGMGRYADPSGVIAAEMVMGRLSTEKGEWAALARTGAKDAILFVPAPVYAQRWLKGQHGSPASIKWQTRQVFMSCDGRAAVSTGIFVQSDGDRGWYSNVWRRDPKAGFQWILSHKGPLTQDREVTDEIDARVGQCRRQERAPGDERGPPPVVAIDTRQPAPMKGENRSDDGSLRWRWAVAPDHARTLDVWMATDKGEEHVVADAVPPPSGS